MIELLVSIGIFSILLLIVSGIFSRFMLIERHGIAEGQLISDLRSAMESFTKEARTAYGSTYNVSGQVITFVNQAGVCVAYNVSATGVFQRAEEGPVGSSSECTPGALDVSKFAPLTGNQTKIVSINFIPVIATTSAGTDLATQGAVTISITAQSTVSDILPIKVENTVTSRQISAYAP